MRVIPLPFACMTRRALSTRSPSISRTMKTSASAITRLGESGKAYSFIRPLGRHTSSRPNVWLVKQDGENEFIAKGPSREDERALGWPTFHHELKMQRLFNEEKMIRPMVDFIPSSDMDDPMMVLAPFEQTLWQARNARPMTTSEIKWIMEGVLLGIQTIHRRGLVHTDLKMENIGITGFDNDKPNENVREIIVRIVDCGSISQPGSREISSLTYRSPEVYFGKPWDQSTDIWSWGIILAQLLLAQVDFTSPGMYDAISTGALDNKTQVARERMVADFDLFSVPLYTEGVEGPFCLRPYKRPDPDDIYMWAVEMSEKGISGDDIQFLVDVLNPRPDVRPTAEEIIRGGYLKVHFE
ncbi:kinase-like domain-containing protein [Xylaria sp. FL0933]|nr:kinase-like domain-containing protein [Xylaria sp. FL0933]